MSSRWGTIAVLLAIGCRLATATEDVLPETTTAAALPASSQLGSEGGKDRMTELLHWALEHNDPERLKEVMRSYKESNLTLEGVYGKDILDALLVEEASVMQGLVAQIADFRNASLSDDALEDALTQLQDLVDQVDNAGNLHRMGGLLPLLDLGLGVERPSETRALALWALGIAVQNNAPVQADLLGLGGLHRLAARLLDCSGSAAVDAQYCGKLLFALSGLIKNNATTQVAAGAAGVFDWLLDEGLRHSSVSVAKKALGLLETVLAQNPEMPLLDSLPERRVALAGTLLARIQGGADDFDTDAADKALRLLSRLISLRPLLFGLDFKERLAAAAGEAVRRCRSAQGGADDEYCEGLADIAGQVEAILSAQDVRDEEL